MTPFPAVAKATLVCAGIALAFSWAFGVGEYGLAPDGNYNSYAVESVSHDWHQYLVVFLHGATMVVCTSSPRTNGRLHILGLACADCWRSSFRTVLEAVTPGKAARGK